MMVAAIAVGIYVLSEHRLAEVGGVTLPPVSVVGSYEESEGYLGRLRLAEGFVPPLEDARFGANVTVHIFTPTWALMDAAVSGRTLYVVYEPRVQYAFDYVAVLENGVIRNIPLPRAYRGLGFTDNGKLLQGLRPLGGGDVFRLTGDIAEPVAHPNRAPLDRELYKLSDGHYCDPGAPGSGVAILEDDGHGHTRPLLTAAALKAASGGYLDNGLAVYCRHFDGQDFASVGSVIRIVYRISKGRAEPIATGNIVASNDDVMLLENTDHRLLEARVTP